MPKLAALIVVILLASCGGDGGSDGTPRPTGPQFLTLPELIDALDDVGCDLVEVDPVEGFDINRQAECNDGSLLIYTFGSSVSEREVVEQIQTLEGRFAVEGDLWAAEAGSRRMAERVKSAVGGTIRPGR